jgi:hypothetical protein
MRQVSEIMSLKGNSSGMLDEEMLSGIFEPLPFAGRLKPMFYYSDFVEEKLARIFFAFGRQM